jgi:hypothetical protein
MDGSDIPAGLDLHPKAEKAKISTKNAINPFFIISPVCGVSHGKIKGEQSST